MENTIYKDKYGKPIQWSMVMECLSPAEEHKALDAKEYHKCLSWEFETLQEAKEYADEQADYMACVLDESHGCCDMCYEVTFILYDQEEDKLLQEIDYEAWFYRD